MLKKKRRFEKKVWTTESDKMRKTVENHDSISEDIQRNYSKRKAWELT